MYSVSTGNQGLVMINQMTDYVNRGEGLSHMCLYEYPGKVYKVKLKEDDIEKNEKTLKKLANVNKKQ